MTTITTLYRTLTILLVNAMFTAVELESCRGANDDEDMVGSSPVPRRHPGPRDRAERDRDRRGNDERHAKYYDEPREPKSSNQRRNR